MNPLLTKPEGRRPIYQLLEEAGMVNVPADRSHRSNWAFEEDDLLILVLWWETLDHASETYSDNYRDLATGNSGRVLRAGAVDRAIRRSLRESLPLRVIFNTGQTPVGVSATAKCRILDPVSWYVRSYEDGGDFKLQRGLPSIDQYCIGWPAQLSSPKAVRTSSAYYRSRSLRDAALLRANGRCMLCGDEGFLLPDGRRYLETHHIIPLSEGGLDVRSNLAALCANDHRQAHFGASRLTIRRKLLTLNAES